MNAIASNCPNCEYLKRGGGTPADLGNGLWRCGDCGNTWREIVVTPASAAGDSPEITTSGVARRSKSGASSRKAPEVEIPTGTDKPARSGTNANVAPDVAGDEPQDAEPADFADTLALLRRKGAESAGPTAPQRKNAGYGAAFGVTAAAAAVLAGWLGTAALVSHWPAAGSWIAGLRQQTGALELSVTSADRIPGSDGSAVRIGGSITNRSSQRQMLDTIEIVLTDAGGGEMGGWRFRPALQYLEAGQSVRFTSAKGSVPALALGVEIRFASARQRIAFGISADAHRPQQEDRGSVQRRADRREES
ncbi:MAG: hypothetical protein KDJ90_13480 [Nitratireductor sp.]|nr:hypothetical protein [Nitratireductor sp.]